MKHIISVDDLYPEMIDEIVDRANRIKRFRRYQTQQGSSEAWFDLTSRLRNRLMITDFFEPSTRTRLSFEAAMIYLGGSVIGTENAAEFSSFKKGESLEDNFKVISGYCDIIVGRFLNEGEARVAARASDVPVINGGDGKGEHPTQALIDLFSIIERLGDLDYGSDLNVLFFGDNKRSRTVQSLARLLAPRKRIKTMRFASPGYLKTEETLLADVRRRAYRDDLTIDSQTYISAIDQDILHATNIVYVTRSQDERSGAGGSGRPIEVPGTGLVFEPHYLDRLPEQALILHPLPRNSELPVEIDKDPRAYYFEQAKNGLYVRMALLEWIFQDI